MPLLSIAHSQYWAGPSGPPLADEAINVTYPEWMTSVTLGSGFGALQPALAIAWAQLVTVLRVTVEHGDAR